MVLVEGRLQVDPKTGGPRTYTRQDGTIGSNFEIYANNIRFLSPREDGQEGGGGEGGDGAAHDGGDNIPF
jgi:single-strand DNA-binding protein